MQQTITSQTHPTNPYPNQANPQQTQPFLFQEENGTFWHHETRSKPSHFYSKKKMRPSGTMMLMVPKGVETALVSPAQGVVCPRGMEGGALHQKEESKMRQWFDNADNIRAASMCTCLSHLLQGCYHCCCLLLGAFNRCPAAWNVGAVLGVHRLGLQVVQQFSLPTLLRYLQCKGQRLVQHQRHHQVPRFVAPFSGTQWLAAWCSPQMAQNSYRKNSQKLSERKAGCHVHKDCTPASSSCGCKGSNKRKKHGVPHGIRIRNARLQDDDPLHMDLQSRCGVCLLYIKSIVGVDFLF